MIKFKINSKPLQKILSVIVGCERGCANHSFISGSRCCHCEPCGNISSQRANPSLSALALHLMQRPIPAAPSTSTPHLFFKRFHFIVVLQAAEARENAGRSRVTNGKVPCSVRVAIKQGKMTGFTLRDGQADLPSPTSTSSYWHRSPSQILLGHRTTERLPETVDVVVIGSGITGAFAARELVERKGRQVLMLEAREVAWGATGRVSPFPYSCLPLLSLTLVPFFPLPDFWKGGRRSHDCFWQRISC